MSRLGQQVGGIYYKSPIVVSSSPLTDRIELIKRAEDNGAGAVSTKLTLIKAPVKAYAACTPSAIILSSIQ